MSLKETLTNDMKIAMKAKEKEKLTTIRLITSAIKNKEIETKNDIKDDEVLGILQKEIKQANESIESYSQDEEKYQDKITQLKNRIEVLETYLPKQLTLEEIETEVKKAIDEVGAVGKSDMGKVMGKVMPKLKGKADGKAINQAVVKLLNQ